MAYKRSFNQIAADNLLGWAREDLGTPTRDFRQARITVFNGRWLVQTDSIESTSSMFGCGVGDSFAEAYRTIDECGGSDCPRCKDFTVLNK